MAFCNGAWLLTLSLIPFDILSKMSCFLFLFLFLTNKQEHVKFVITFLYVMVYNNMMKRAVLTGTVVMHVGFSTDASPRLPRIILLLVSMSVVGVLYPMGTPVNKQTLSANNSNTWANGKNLNTFYRQINFISKALATLHLYNL